MNINYDYKKLCPFKWFVLQNFPFLDYDFDQITNWGMLQKIGEEINKIINSQNNLGTEVEQMVLAYNALVEYVNHYFDNLDLQDEVNQKLDDMAESGELAEIIAQYIDLTSVFYFNSLEDMIESESLTTNSKAVIIGVNSYVDGGIKTFIIKDTTTMTVDNKFVYELDNGKFAIMVNESIFKNDVDYKRFRYENTNCFIVNFSKTDKYGTPNKLKIGIANDYIGDNHFESTLKFAKRKNTTICTNAGIFNADSPYQIWGACIIDGEIKVNNPMPESDPGLNYLTIDENGRFGYVSADNITPAQMIAQGIKNAVLGFFPIIVDGQAVSHTYPWVDGNNRRQVVCELYDGTQFIFACEGLMVDNVGLTWSQIQTYLLTNYPNLKFAMAMDGGGSLSINAYKQKLNISYDDSFTTDRAVPYFLYLANENATNTNQDDKNKILDVMSEQIKNLQDQIISLKNLYTNRLTMIAQGQYPDIRVHTNGNLSNPSCGLSFERGHVGIQSTDEDGTNFETIFAVSKYGISLKDGKNLANYFEEIPAIEDLEDNTNLRSGLYYTNSDTLHKPTFGNFMVLVERFTNGAIVETLFPFNQNYGMLYKVYKGSTWSGFIVPTPVNNSANREGAEFLGQMYFDTTLGKPVWYDGTKWVDATGTQA